MIEDKSRHTTFKKATGVYPTKQAVDGYPEYFTRGKFYPFTKKNVNQEQYSIVFDNGTTHDTNTTSGASLFTPGVTATINEVKESVF